MSPLARRMDAAKYGLRHPPKVVCILLVWPLLATVGAVLFTAASGCVVPIGPDFHDKPAPEAIPPIRPLFVAESPAFQRTIQLDASTSKPAMFTVRVEDPNPKDAITVLWVLNYPPFTPGATGVFPAITMGPGENMQPFLFNLTCDEVKLYPFADRNLTVIASDNDFDSSPDTLADQPNRLNYDADHQYLPTMAGWSLKGCQ